MVKFFEDDDLVLKRRVILKAPPPIPDTGWKPPTEFPNLSAATVISFDTENKEDDFKSGPGWAREKSSIAGFSVGARDNRGNTGNWYFPIRHAVETEYNLEPDRCLRWLNYILTCSDIPKVGAHLIYDVGTLTDEGIFVRGPLYDVQFAEALIDEDAFVALETLGRKYCGEGKTTDLLKEWIMLAYKPNVTEWRSDIWRAPPRLVGPYGEQDAGLPLRVLTKQWPILEQQGLMNVFQMECKLIRLLVRMRMRGIRVDLDRARQIQRQLGFDIQRLYAELQNQTGIACNVNSGDSLSKVFDVVGIKYPRTADGNPSFRKDWLKNLDHPVGKLVNDIREHEKLKSTFVERAILQKHHNGRIYPQFHPLKDDKYGTGVGRFSSSDPNVQQIPGRSKLGNSIRSIFVPDIGHIQWEKRDYSQLQYRGLAVYAVDDGDGSAEALRQDYRDNPKTDYHKRIQDKFKETTGVAMERRPVKNMNFGMVFGLGKAKLIRSTGITGKAGEEFYELFHKIVPYAKPTLKALGEEVQTNGYTLSPLGRRCRFNLWVPAERDYQEYAEPLTYTAALMHYGANIKRADDYTGIAYKLQSFEADVIKKSLVDCYEAGIFEVTGLPLTLVHDEWNFSVKPETPEQIEAYAAMTHIMENSIPLPVPLKVDVKRGTDWGAFKED